MKTPHKHADLIKAWTDGAEIEIGWAEHNDWEVIKNPQWDRNWQFRIKPEPKPEQDWEGIAADQAMTIALMKSEQEPVAYIGMIDEEHFADVCRKAKGNSNTPLHTSPPARKWVGLMDMERLACQSFSHAQTAINTEAKLKELNT